MRKPEPLPLHTPLVRLEPRSHVNTSCKLLRLTHAFRLARTRGSAD